MDDQEIGTCSYFSALSWLTLRRDLPRTAEAIFGLTFSPRPSLLACPALVCRVTSANLRVFLAAILIAVILEVNFPYRPYALRSRCGGNRGTSSTSFVRFGSPAFRRNSRSWCLPWQASPLWFSSPCWLHSVYSGRIAAVRVFGISGETRARWT